MEMHQVRYFLAVCDTLNFTRAAKQCNVSQPSLTRAIGKLEQELGGPLFRRERNFTHLTDLGRLLRPHLEKVEASVEAAQSDAKSFHEMSVAPLRMGVMCTIGPGHLIELMSKVRSEITGLDLTLHEASLSNLIDRMASGEMDIALMASPDPLPERFDFRPLYEERYVVAFPPGHRFEQQDEVRLRDMDQESYLVRLNCEYDEYIGALLDEQGVTLKLPYRSEREDWIQSMIMAGMGCTFLPEHLLLHPGLQNRVIADPGVTRTIGLATVAGRRFSPAVQTFVQIATRHTWPTSA